MEVVVVVEVLVLLMVEVVEVVVCYYTLQRHCVEVSAARTTTDSWPQSASQSVS